MKNGEIAYLAFTEKGRALAETLCAVLGGEVSCTRDGVALQEWTARAFPNARALVFIGAAGIAVRAIAPYLHGKASDPAVVAVDECGYFAVSLLSGHLGGANALTREIARICGAEAVITTATDRNGVFAFDDWARVQGLSVADPGRIKAVSAKLLAGKRIRVRSAFPIDGAPPAGVELPDDGEADVWVDVRRDRGLAAFCATHGWPLHFYTAAELASLRGEFTASAFVARMTGVDNVCERAAVKCAQGELIVKKHAGDGVTFALARRPLRLDWGVGRG